MSSLGSARAPTRVRRQFRLDSGLAVCRCVAGHSGGTRGLNGSPFGAAEDVS